MLSTTAAEAASVRFSDWRLPPRPASTLKSPWHLTFRRQLSDSKPEKDVHEVRAIPATWLSVVQRRIQNSTAPMGQDVANDGRWLNKSIADAAKAFFERTSDVLPGESHIYCSLKGHLVAEFSGTHGTMTNIVSETSVIVFAVVDGTPVEKRFSLGKETNALRQELQRITELLHTGLYGTQVESKN
jgi:hypothetical protein